MEKHEIHSSVVIINMKLLDIMRKAIENATMAETKQFLYKCKHENKTTFRYRDWKHNFIETEEVCIDCGKTLGITRKVIE